MLSPEASLTLVRGSRQPIDNTWYLWGLQLAQRRRRRPGAARRGIGEWDWQRAQWLSKAQKAAAERHDVAVAMRA